MKENKIRKNYEYRAIYKRGRSFSNALLVLYLVKNNKGLNRLGISVSKKVGISVIRSRVKRLISESYRLNCIGLKGNYDLVFIARVNSSGKSYIQIEEALRNLLKKAGLITSENNIN